MRDLGDRLFFLCPFVSANENKKKKKKGKRNEKARRPFDDQAICIITLKTVIK